MTYYTEIRKSIGENERRSFERVTLLRKKIGTRIIEIIKDEKDADETVHKRATKKIIGFR